jgi:hypothetical protein
MAYASVSEGMEKNMIFWWCCDDGKVEKPGFSQSLEK